MPSLTAASLALFLWLKNIGMAMAARMPMMMITIRSSMSVKPRWPALLFIVPAFPSVTVGYKPFWGSSSDFRDELRPGRAHP